MKKYYLSGIVALAIGAMFTSCSKDSDLYDESSVEQQEALKIQQQYAELRKSYNDAFTKEFGTIAPGHDWGFGTTATTRAAINNVSGIDGFYELPEDAAFNSKFQNFNKYGEGMFCVFYQAYLNVQNGKAVNYNMNKEVLNNLYSGKPFGNKKTGAVAVSDHYLTLQELKNELGDLSNYYVQQIYKNTRSNPQHKDFGKLYAYNHISNAWEYVEGFEAGKAEHADFIVKQNKKISGYTLMAGMGNPTESDLNFLQWNYKDYPNDYDSDYKILKIEGDYYIGMNDLHASSNNHQEVGEGADYCSWIIRIAKAQPTTTTIPEIKQARIFCEDMGNIGDFDFNDLVFDAVVKSNNDIEITVLAAGGIYDYTIDGVAVTLGEMTNTGVNEADRQTFTIKANGRQPKYSNFKDIPIVVYPKGQEAALYHYELNAEPNEAPQKFCTYVDVEWADEYVNIKRVYPKFQQWVNTYTPAEWGDQATSRFIDLDLTNND